MATTGLRLDPAKLTVDRAEFANMEQLSLYLAVDIEVFRNVEPDPYRTGSQ